YYFGSQRVALRRTGHPDPAQNGLFFLHADHLGSTSLTTDEDGGDAVQQWYYPYGGQRAADGDLPTDYRFTGQRFDSYINLYQMGDRWYNAELGRWISPDPIIPEPGNPQALNRYSYVYNNPLKYIDPTGHWADSGDTDVEEQQNADPPPPPPMGTWEYIRWLLTLVPEGQEVLTYINSHGTKIYIIGSLQDAGNSLYPNNMIILNASRFSAQDLATQIDVAGDIGHEVEHQIWGPRGALWPSREQEGAAFARGDAVKAALFRYFGDEATAATYKFPDMTTEQRIANLQDNPEYGSGWYTDHQIWGVDLVRDMGSTIQWWYNDWWFNTYCSGNVEGVYP
ncbi:MAG: RHS repeat-associated core domain-containing protein, partial [Chloroflexi bacterium]|nr:RHS repeat-associated core domain-containing protein [Chloroflexota bacterium]